MRDLVRHLDGFLSSMDHILEGPLMIKSLLLFELLRGLNVSTQSDALLEFLGSESFNRVRPRK